MFCPVLLCVFSVLGLRLAPCGFGSPRPRGVGHLPARVTPAFACWRRRGGCFAWGCSWSWLFLSSLDGSDSESSADEAVGDVPPVRLHLAEGQHQLIPSFSGGCVASQLVGKGLRLVGLQLFCAVAWVGIDTYGVVGWELLCPL